MGPFDADEVIRVQKSLERRFASAAYPEVVAIGMGLAVKSKRPDPDRGLTVCFYVRRKLNPRNKDSRLPKVVRVRAKTDGKFKTVDLPTDVVEISGIQPSGTDVEGALAPGRRDDFTGGVWLEWIVSGNPDVQGGLVTIGHGVGYPEDLGAADLLVAFAASTQFGVLVDKARVNQNRIDASIVTMYDPRALAAQIGAFFPISAIRPLNSVIGDTSVKARGESLTRNQKVVSFSLEAYSASFLMPKVGLLKNVVRVRSSQAGAFKKGRSGSPWTIVDSVGNKHLAMIQVGTDAAAGDTVGYGQILDQSAANWAISRIEQEPNVVPGSAAITGYV